MHPRLRGDRARGASAAAWATAFAVLLAACGSAPRPNLLLVVIDTCRANHMSVYGYRRSTTPTLERLGSEGVVFEQTVTHVPQTLPSAATILTSRLPAEHGVRVNGLFRLSEKEVTLAEVLREAGYQTAAVVSGFPLDPRFGTQQGFEFYDADFRDSILTRTPREGILFQGTRHFDFEQRADEATAKAFAWLRSRNLEGEQPFFLLVHYFDPHHPYNPPSRYNRDLGPYDAELAFVDAEIGRLLAFLRNAQLLDATLVVVVGDHGELLRPTPRHAGYVEDAVLRVPLILRAPGSLPRGVRIAGQTALVDVAPTLLELLGVTAPPEFRGHSLVPAIRSGRATSRPAVPFETLYWKLEMDQGFARHGVRTETHKYVIDVRQEDGATLGREALYDLVRDPRERTNLVADDAGLASHRELLESLRSKLAELTPPEGSAEALPLTPDVEERLRSLGYLGR